MRWRLASWLCLGGALLGGALADDAAAADAGPGAEAAAPSAEELELLWTRFEAQPPPKVTRRKAAGEGTSREGGAAGSGGARTPSSGEVAARAGASGGPGEPPANEAHGSLTLGYAGSLDASDEGPDRTWHAPRLGALVTVDRIGGAPLRLRLRGDARAILVDADRRDRSGSRLDRRIYLTEASLTYEGESNPARISLGRTFAGGASQAGFVDGGRAGAALGPLEAGGFGGLDAAPDLSDRERVKWGAYAALEGALADTVLSRLAVSFVQTTDHGDLDRRLVALDGRIELSSLAWVYALAEVDLYGADAPNPLDRPSTDLTSVHVGARVRPLDPLDLGLSVDRRRIFLGARELRDIDPTSAALFDPGVLVTWRADARLALPERLYVRGGADLRRGGGESYSASAEVGCDAIAESAISAALSAGYLRSRYLRSTLTSGADPLDPAASFRKEPDLGLREVSLGGRAGAFLGGAVDVSLGYTLRVLRYDDDLTGDLLRHEMRASIDWLFTTSLSALAEGTFETGDEVRRGTLVLAITYRF